MAPKAMQLRKRKKDSNGQVIWDENIYYDGMVADMWSLGIVIYELVTLYRPYRLVSGKEYWTKVPNVDFEFPGLPSETPGWLVTLYQKLCT
jgi:serine/threonine protein kinase